MTSDQGQKDALPQQKQQEQMTSTARKGIELLDELRLKPGETIEPVTPSLLQKVRIHRK